MFVARCSSDKCLYIELVLQSTRCAMWQGSTAVKPLREVPWEGVPAAADEGVREGAWDGCLAFANLGLPGNAIRGAQWDSKHKTFLQKFIADIVAEVQQPASAASSALAAADPPQAVDSAQAAADPAQALFLRRQNLWRNRWYEDASSWLNVLMFKDALSKAKTLAQSKVLHDALQQGVFDIEQRSIFHCQCLGLLLCEVNNITDPLLGESRTKFSDVITDAIANATGVEPTIVWASGQGETMAACLPCANMERLPQMNHVDMPSVHDWRVVDRFLIQGASEHGSPTLLVYNQHQPSSKDRPWPTTMRIIFCGYILIDAMDICSRDRNCVGFVFGGDANCGIAHWSPAMDEVKSWKNTLSNLTYVQGIQQKPGDFIVAASVKGRGDFIVYKNTCRVKGREKTRDPMVFKLSWTRGAQFQSRVEEAANGGEPASGATEHSVASAPAIVNIPWHDSWAESSMQQIAADCLVAE